MKNFTKAPELALHGGKPVRKKPLPPMFPGGMAIGVEEKRAVLEVIGNKALFRYGVPYSLSKVSRFEKEFAGYMGARHALAVTSGTSALIVSLVGAGIGPGDEVIVPAFTFIASVGAIVAARAVPILAEIDKSLNMDPYDFEKKITERTKAVMPVHMRGCAARMGEIMEIARKNNLKVIEDCAQSCGASYKARKVGTIGDVGAFSFQYNKIITTGDGGAVVTDNKDIFARCVSYHDQGHRPHREGGNLGRHLMFGVNYRMNEITGAVAIEQLHKLDALLGIMKRNKNLIKDGISGIKGAEFREIPDEAGDTGICIIFFLPAPKIAKEFAKALCAENIDASVIHDWNWHVYSHFPQLLTKKTVTSEGCPFACPLYKGKVEYKMGMCPVTDRFLQRAIHINVSPLLSESDINDIINGVRKVSRNIL